MAENGTHKGSGEPGAGRGGAGSTVCGAGFPLPARQRDGGRLGLRAGNGHTLRGGQCAACLARPPEGRAGGEPGAGLPRRAAKVGEARGGGSVPAKGERGLRWALIFVHSARPGRPY